MLFRCLQDCSEGGQYETEKDRGFNCRRITDNAPLRRYWNIGQYFSAYAVYENELDNYDDYDEYENDEYSGTESDSEADSDSERNPLKSFIISLIIGIVIAAVSVGIMWSQMKTVRSQSGAANYEKKDTFKLRESTDTFLYKRLDKTPKPQNPPEKN